MKLVSNLYQKLVRESLFENDSTMVHGNKTYIVHLTCTQDSSDEEKMMSLSILADSPEKAKTAAMKIASDEMGHESCKITGVEMVPNSDEEKNDYGSGKDMNADPKAKTAGLVKPSDD